MTPVPAGHGPAFSRRRRSGAGRERAGAFWEVRNMRSMSFMGGVMLGAVLGSAACIAMMPTRKTKNMLGKALKSMGEVVDSISEVLHG